MAVFEDIPRADAPALEGPLLMDAVLTPNRSLTRGGFVALLAAIVAVIVLAGVFYVTAGAWPVLGFLGLDVVLVIVAFRLSYRQGRMSEWVRVSADQVQVTRRHPDGREQHFASSPVWARVEVRAAGEHAAEVRLTSRGEGVILGAFLSPPEREAFGAALRAAIQAARDVRHDV